MSATPYTDDELLAIERDAASQLRALKFQPQGVVRLLFVTVPRLCTELREARKRYGTASEAIDLACENITILETQLAARDAQIVRLRQIVEHEEVAT